MLSSSELTKTSSPVITPLGQRPNPVNKARKLQQATQNTVKSNTEPATKDTVIIESEVDGNLLSFSQSGYLPQGFKTKPTPIYYSNSTKHYDELALLSKRKARAILRIGNVSLNRLINEGKIKIIIVNEKEKIPFVSLQEYVYNMSSKQETATGEYKIIDEEEAEIITNKILEEINKGEI